MMHLKYPTWKCAGGVGLTPSGLEHSGPAGQEESTLTVTVQEQRPQILGVICKNIQGDAAQGQASACSAGMPYGYGLSPGGSTSNTAPC